MDEAKQMTVEEALSAADRMLDPDDGGVEEFMECGLDVVDTLGAEVRRLTAALAAARREGAEAMRADVKRVFVLHRAVREGREEALRAEGVPQGDCAFLCLATAVVSLDRVMREVEALPLPGDATGGEP